ncbi:MAG: GAF domain-containing sensor histidine kinase [Chloroflexi bacterium]|nr:GAF domain-containing sensor histidine kinase [Chloroflexota bacterium]
MDNHTSYENQLHYYQRLIDISRDLASTLELDVLLKRIINVSVELSESQAASILLYDEATRQLYFQITTNMEEPTLRGINVPLEGSIAGWVILNRKIASVADVHKDPRFFANVEKTTNFPTTSLIAVPMITKDKVVGVLEVLNKKTGEYTEADEDILNVLSTQAAVAIQNTRLFQQSDLISELVHEIRTPLASVGTAAYLLQRPEISDQQRFSLASTIYIETQRLNEMASSFLDLARLESGRVAFHATFFDLPTLLSECRSVLEHRANESQVKLLIHLPANLPVLEADRDRLKQVVLNLLSNAIKYNRSGGEIEVTAEVSENELAVSFRDTGVGIPEEALPHVFEKFYRARGIEKVSGGTGLGLSICQHILASHGGRIEVASKMGEGSIFTIYLPLRQS